MSRAPRCPVWILLDSNICCQKLKMTFIKWRVSVYVKIVSLIRNKNDYFPARSAWRLRKLISLWDTFNFHDVLLSYYWDFDTLTYNRSNLLKTQSNIWNTNDSAAQQCPINGGLEIIIQHSETPVIGPSSTARRKVTVINGQRIVSTNDWTIITSFNF